jgi:hypothetical protein
LAAQYLAELLDDTCQVEVIGSVIESEASMRLCAELCPDAVLVDVCCARLTRKPLKMKASQRLADDLQGQRLSKASSTVLQDDL